MWADQRHGRSVFCRVREQHRWAWSCTSARSVLFSSADVRGIPRRHERRTASGLVEGQQARRTLMRVRAGRQADPRHGRRIFCRVCERHRWAWSCISARSVLFSSAGVQLNLPRTRAAHCKRACRMAAGTAENPAGTGGKTGRPSARTACLLPSARVTPESGELHRCAVNFCFQARAFG